MSATRLVLAFSAAAILGCASSVPPRAQSEIGPPGATICGTSPKPLGIVAAEAILPGYGNGGFRIVTADPAAQAYFDNGMQLAHAFAHEAATAAFLRAEAIDPTCAMCVWGEAWSRGPTINFGIDERTAATAAKLVARAAALATRHHDAREDALIAALAQRYREGGDVAFAGAMDALARAYPADDEIAIIAADAWMIPAARNTDRDHLDRSVELLAGVLARSPDDTGAIHFYIHATEMNGIGATALPYVARLQALAPAASHLVHMPSHTYFWVGRYRAAEQSNLDAVALDERDAARLRPAGGLFALPYHRHNVLFGMVSALMAGDTVGALSLAEPVVARVPTIEPSQSWDQVALATAYAIYGRDGSDAQLRALPEPPATLPFARAMWHYALGEAAARSGDLDGLMAHARAIEPVKLDAFGDFAPQGEAMITVARAVLDGRAAMLTGRWKDAAAAYRRAADLQEKTLAGDADPPAWWYPVRRSLAAALLADGDPVAAETEVRRALDRWQDDPVGLAILSGAAARAGRDAESLALRSFARSRWSGDLASVTPALM
jgi:tetratricopeptide (TPR) repeat protein